MRVIYSLEGQIFQVHKVRDLVDNGDIRELLHNQVFKVVYRTIKFDNYFNKNIVTENLNNQEDSLESLGNIKKYSNLFQRIDPSPEQF